MKIREIKRSFTMGFRHQTSATTYAHLVHLLLVVEVGLLGSKHELLIVQASPLVQTQLAADLAADGDGGVLEAVDG